MMIIYLIVNLCALYTIFILLNDFDDVSTTIKRDIEVRRTINAKILVYLFSYPFLFLYNDGKIITDAEIMASD